MEVSILTIGDELLSGRVENTNGSWLASRLTDQGAIVRAIVTLPDEVAALRTTVADHSDRFDAVVVTGGLGSTPDDVTVDARAAALDWVRSDRRRPPGIGSSTSRRSTVRRRVRWSEHHPWNGRGGRSVAQRCASSGSPARSRRGFERGAAQR